MSIDCTHCPGCDVRTHLEAELQAVKEELNELKRWAGAGYLKSMAALITALEAAEEALGPSEYSDEYYETAHRLVRAALAKVRP